MIKLLSPKEGLFHSHFQKIMYIYTFIQQTLNSFNKYALHTDLGTGKWQWQCS